jgi:hypothetical protein
VALAEAVGALASPAGSGGRAVQRWRGALCEEFAYLCRLLASRCAAIAPEHWRDFDAAHPTGAAEAIATLLAAWQHAGLRALRLRDECGRVAAEPAPDAASRA